MSDLAEAFASAAEGLVGSPFRLHGRCPTTGVDCVGLVILSLRSAGREVISMPAYRLRNSDYGFVEQLAKRNGFAEAVGPVGRGDLLMVEAGPAQRHLLVAQSHTEFIHAHAGLRRVVRLRGELPWPLFRHWRLQ